MSKYNTIDVWNLCYGKKEDVKDYAGRLMQLSKGGSDVLDNIIICHRDTNEEKADKFPHWEANSRRFHAVRIKGSRVEYKIIED